MAISITPKASGEIAAEGYTPEQLLMLAIEAFKQLKWNIGPVSAGRVLAYTGSGMSSWSGDELTLDVSAEKATIKSASLDRTLIDFGRNKKNIRSFLSTFEELKAKISKEELDNLFRQKSADPAFITASGPEISPADVSGFSLFKPAKGYVFTPLLLFLNTLIFILMCLGGANIMEPTPDILVSWGANFRPSTLDGEWWRLITCCFVHIGLIHLLMNMYALLSVGILLEPLLGSRKFIMAYLLSGITGSLLSLGWHDFTVSAGASGAIFGLYGVFLALLTTNIIEKTARTGLLSSILVFVVYNLINGMKGNIDNAAHIGGLLGGLLTGYCYYPLLKDPAAVKPRNIVMGSLSAGVIILAITVCMNMNNDLLIFNENMERFSIKEKNALEIYNMPAGTDKEDALKKIKRGIGLWNENIALITASKTLRLPDYYKLRNDLLLQYSFGRLNCFQLIYKSVEEDTDKYNPQIEAFNKQVKSALDKLDSQSN